jgi:hypothetical protein
MNGLGWVVPDTACFGMAVTAWWGIVRRSDVCSGGVWRGSRGLEPRGTLGHGRARRIEVRSGRLGTARIGQSGHRAAAARRGSPGRLRRGAVGLGEARLGSLGPFRLGGVW